LELQNSTFASCVTKKIKRKAIDASFVEVPRQRNKKSENEQIKESNGSELWNDKPKKKRQKDIDARWTKKDKQTFFGYKNHVKEDDKSKLIPCWCGFAIRALTFLF